MSLPHDLNRLEAHHIRDLITNKVPESTTLDYKQNIYGGNDKDKKEFLKDVSALANSQGGWLIIGIRENDGVAEEIIPLSGSADDTKLRLDSMLRDGLEPRLSYLQIKDISFENGYVIVIRTSKSPLAPHRVILDKANKFWMRTSTANYEPNVNELRRLFSEYTSIQQRCDLFRRRRLEVISNDQAPIPFHRDLGYLVIHIMQLADSVGSYIPLQGLDGEMQRLAPPGGTSMIPRYNYEGFIAHRPLMSKSGRSAGYTQLFRTGEIEITKGEFLSSQDDIPRLRGREVERIIKSRLSDYIDVLATRGINPPLVVAISIVGTTGVVAYLGDDFANPQPITQNEILLPPCIIESTGSSEAYLKALKPALDTLWNTGDCPEWVAN